VQTFSSLFDMQGVSAQDVGIREIAAINADAAESFDDIALPLREII
jgi:hypothetical protein